MDVIYIHAIILSSKNWSVSQAIVLSVIIAVAGIVRYHRQPNIYIQYMQVLLVPILLKKLFKEQQYEEKAYVTQSV